MSHFTSVKTKIRDQEALVEALESMGYTVESHKWAVPLNTVWRDNAMAEIVIRKASIGAGADVGFSRQEDGTFALVGDQMYSAVRKLSERLPARYGATVVLRQARIQGDTCDVTENADGTITIMVTPKPVVTRVAQGQATASKQQQRVRR